MAKVGVESAFVVVASVVPVLQVCVVLRRHVLVLRHRRDRAIARCPGRRQPAGVVRRRDVTKTLVVVTPPSAAADLLHNLVFGAWHRAG